MNWAIVTSIKDHPLVTLLYEGWVYRHSFERHVELPFDENSAKFPAYFKILLKRIFAPFVELNSVHRSLISVTPSLIEKDCFFVTLLLIFLETKGKEGEKARIIQEALDKVADAQNDIRGKVFWLD